MPVSIEIGGTSTFLVEVPDGSPNITKVPSKPASPDVGKKAPSLLPPLI